LLRGRTTEFAFLRLWLIKVAARVVETATRIRVALTRACPDAALFRHIALTLRAARRKPVRPRRRSRQSPQHRNDRNRAASSAPQAAARRGCYT